MKLLASLFALSLLITTPTMSAENSVTLPNLEGHWTGKTKEDVELSFAFTKTGQVTYKINDQKFKQTFPNGFVGKYKIVAGKPYSKIDITDFNNTPFKEMKLLGMFEVIDQNSIKIEFLRILAGQSPKRLKKFTKDAVVLKKANK